ncbi:hypothetical protein [Candidatus Rhabdochlamydia sp. T3358]|uniref:hypothetical protein n=1 Tax=Candidatus Rhabdochlamydia sp. T3358 TaxID=2099795 RepID=UPI0010B1B1D4|nr:hypothetical protein [Candidatus Rhabdochlamydia sp. T3358]VHN99662.1 hypothetical protein RHT_00097 [Candidatus Rhabdochlamydia sp. T3358]
MSSIASSLPCQVDGLLRIYTYTEHSVFFEFENQEKLQKAKNAFTLCVTNSSPLHLGESIVLEHTNFVFSVSADAPIKSVEELIRRVTEMITTETSLRKDLPVVPITMEHLIYKG